MLGPEVGVRMPREWLNAGKRARGLYSGNAWYYDQGLVQKPPCLQFYLVATRGHMGTTFSAAGFSYNLASVPSRLTCGDLQTSKEAKQLRLGQSSCPKGWYVSHDPSFRWANGRVAWVKGHGCGALCSLSELQEWSGVVRPVLLLASTGTGDQTEEDPGSVMRHLCNPDEDNDLLGRSGEQGGNCVETGPHLRGAACCSVVADCSGAGMQG